MRILAAVDQTNEPEFLIHQVAELAGNTLANVTFLGICPKEDAVNKMAERLNACRNMFLGRIDREVSPYPGNQVPYTLLELKKGIWNQKYEGKSGRKDLSFRIRCENAGKAIVAESEAAGADLAVIDCSGGGSGGWPDDAIRKVVRNEQCSVLIIKEEKKPRMIVCCLDQDTVTQSSIELINQLVTIYGAELEIVGIKKTAGLSSEVDRRMASILAYYTDQGIKAWIRLVDTGSLKKLVAQTSEKDLMALWMGRESLLDRILPRQRLVDLATNAESSILILR